jgi:hypothetical protein
LAALRRRHAEELDEVEQALYDLMMARRQSAAARGAARRAAETILDARIELAALRAGEDPPTESVDDDADQFDHEVVDA